MAGKSASPSPTGDRMRTNLVTGERSRGKAVNRRTLKRSKRNAKLYGELMEIATIQGVRRVPGSSASDVLQQCLDRARGDWNYACSEVDKLSPEDFWVEKIDANDNILVEPNKWIQYERVCREELERLSGMMVQLGLAERAVKIEETKAALIVAAIRDAARDAGLSPGDTRKLGAALRERVEQATLEVAA